MMMKEYWVNVYDNGYISGKLSGPDVAEAFAKYIAYCVMVGISPIYRIHVKMKEVKPKYDYPRVNSTDKFNWMGS